MQNSFNSALSLVKVNGLVQKIEGICKDIEAWLALCLELSSDKVGGFCLSTSAHVESDYVDRIVLTLQKLQKHLRELTKAIHHDLIRDKKDVQNIVSSLQESSALLTSFLLSNNFYAQTFALPVAELSAAIDHIYNEIHISAYAHAA